MLWPQRREDDECEDAESEQDRQHPHPRDLGQSLAPRDRGCGGNTWLRRPGSLFGGHALKLGVAAERTIFSMRRMRCGDPRSQLPFAQPLQNLRLAQLE